MRRFTLLLAAALLLPLAACGDDDPTEPSEPVLELRVENATTLPMAVVATGRVTSGTPEVADFGTLQAGEVSGFQQMDPSFTVTVDGEPFEPGGGVAFGIDDTPTTRWTLTLLASGGWSLEAYFGS